LSLVDAYLAQRNGVRKPRPEGVLYVTDLAKPCLRSSYYGIVVEREYPMETLRIFETGNILEGWWVEVLRRSADIEVLWTQLKARYMGEGFRVHGRVDVLCQHRDRMLVVHEVKTAKTAHWLQEAKGQHVEQLQFYLGCLGVELGQVDYLDKTVMLHGRDPRRPRAGVRVDKCFRVKRDHKVFKELVNRATVLAKAWESEVPPPADPGWLCRYCLYSDICEEAGSG
jgi:CRISPR/Cas system-associated exonuclease Cas4 (RecB family)